MSAFLEYRETSGKKGSYNFCQKSEIEYLSSVHICRKLTEGLALKDVLTIEHRKFQEILPFIVGGLKNKLPNYFQDILYNMPERSIDELKFRLVYNLILEVNTEKNVVHFEKNNCKECLCRDVVAKLPKTKWTMRDMYVVYGLSILKHCMNIRLDEVEIDIPITFSERGYIDKEFEQCLLKQTLIEASRYHTIVMFEVFQGVPMMPRGRRIPDVSPADQYSHYGQQSTYGQQQSYDKHK